MTFALPASADIAPPDSCSNQGATGTACSNAGPNYDQAGVCTAETCERPGPDGSTSYDCILCEIVDAGMSNDASPTKTAPSSPSSSGGCAYSPDVTKGLTGFTMFLVGLVALAFARRRRA
jgi:hypothetical protein